VAVSPQAGGPGTTVKISADVSGCTQPKSAKGTFYVPAARPLIRQGVIGGRFTAQYLVTKRDPVGLGRFGVVCDNAIPGFAPFRVKPSSSPVPVGVTPQAASRGTTVKITAQVGWCRQIHIWFYDHKSDGLTEAGGAKPIKPNLPIEDGKVTASYTLTRMDAIGPARFRVVCGIDIDNARVGEASFRVLAANGQPSGGNDQTTNRNDRNDNTQLPNRIDTGLGGTADGGGSGGLDLTRLLLPAGLLLIVVGAGLGLRQAARSRR
jgi:hypothetical protein